MTVGGAIIGIGAFVIAGLGWLAAMHEHRKVQAYKAKRDAATLPVK